MSADERRPRLYSPAPQPYRLLETAVNVLLRPVPTKVIAAMAATAISAAISPYSIAVTPDSFFIKFVKSVSNRISSS